MQQSAEHQLIDLAERVRQAEARYNEVSAEVLEMKELFKQTTAYKESFKHQYLMDVSAVPGYDAVFGPILHILNEVRTDKEIILRRFNDWVTGRLRIKGLRVQVVKGRKDIDLKGTVFWYGDSQWGTRVGIKTGEVGPDGKDVVHWNYTRNCDPYLTKDQYDSLF